MPEVPFSGALVSDASSADAAKNTPSQWKRAILAAFLSFLIPRMGQLYNRQPKKALILAATTWIFSLIASQTRILFLFSSMIAFFVLFIAWRLFIVVDAACGAGGAKATQVSVSSKLTYSVVAVFLVAGALFPTNAQFKRWSGFAAFKVPSMSMCPTICSDERIVVDMKAYKSRPPTRGDVVVLEHDSQAPLFIKRVIGIPGDHVGPGRDGAILVNGVPLAIPQACGRSTQKVESAGEDYPSFQHTKVPNGTLFVVGDNLASSLDSRYSQFGQVRFEEVRVSRSISTGHKIAHGSVVPFVRNKKHSQQRKSPLRDAKRADECWLSKACQLAASAGSSFLAFSFFSFFFSS